MSARTQGTRALRLALRELAAPGLPLAPLASRPETAGAPPLLPRQALRPGPATALRPRGRARPSSGGRRRFSGAGGSAYAMTGSLFRTYVRPAMYRVWVGNIIEARLGVTYPRVCMLKTGLEYVSNARVASYLPVYA